HRCGRRPDISDDAEDALLVDQVLHRAEGPARLVSVIHGDQPKLAAADAARVVDGAERRVEAELHLPAEFLGGPAERRRDAEADLAVCHPLTTAAPGVGAGRTGTAAATDAGAAGGAGTTAVAAGGAALPDPSNVTGAAGGATMTVRTDRV